MGSMLDAASAIAKLGFRYPWRPYQVRVLDAIERHLDDDKLHIVAAPGSGKTILGLETFRRLRHPAIVFAPTITIRDQWLARLSLFLPENAEMPAWASNSLDRPGLLTCVTYQSLHAKIRQSEASEPEDEVLAGDDINDEAPELDEIQCLVRTLRESQVRTIILDEAHHLRREWWQALERVSKALTNVTIVSLTATPPYGVIGEEWDRYDSLCGPIDEEISVPELVKSGTLAPHDDFVWAVEPDDQTRALVQAYADAVERTTNELSHDNVLIDAIAIHPWMLDPQNHIREILDTPETAVAMLVLLQHCGRTPPRDAFRLLTGGHVAPPESSRRWWQALIKSYLFDAHWPMDDVHKKHRDALAKRLRAAELLHRRELRIESSRPVRDRIAMSSAKTYACLDIHRLEREIRGNNLRQVILTDYIRDGAPADSGVIQLGAWPIFHELALSATQQDRPRLALLTGRLTLIHENAVESFTHCLGSNAAAVSLVPSNLLDGLVRVTSSRNDLLVPAITRLFADGVIDTIVGTRALLGEGWDAPSINSLILASYVGSYVTTNQMRGRAIRRDPDRPEKAASIWHLVGVESGTVAGLQDAWSMSRRFEAFVGLHAWTPEIESGIERLKLPEPWSPRFIERTNADMRKRIRQVDELANRWRDAIDRGEKGRVIPTIRSYARIAPKRLLVTNTATRMFAAAGAAAIGPIQYGINWLLRSGGDSRAMLQALGIAGTAALLFMLPGLTRAIRTMIRFYPVDGSLRQIGLALRDALIAAQQIKTPIDQTGFTLRKEMGGAVSIALTGVTFYESSIFVDCLREILSPIENPRYLITRRGARWLGQQIDYHAVPTLLGERKESALLFFDAWRRYVGKSDLIYTRNTQGRQVLLRARILAYSSTDTLQTHRLDQWQ